MDSSNNLLHYVLILLIVGVPVGLPVVTTTTLAVGAAYLAKEKAIVQKLTAIESLAVCQFFRYLGLLDLLMIQGCRRPLLRQDRDLDCQSTQYPRSVRC